MSICQLPAIKDYWKTNKYLHYSPIAERIPRDRFIDISRYIHFVDNTTFQPRGSDRHDRLGKVRPLIDHLSGKFSELYNPHKEIAVVAGKVIIETMHAQKASEAGYKGVGAGQQSDWIL